MSIHAHPCASNRFCLFFNDNDNASDCSALFVVNPDVTTSWLDKWYVPKVKVIKRACQDDPKLSWMDALMNGKKVLVPVHMSPTKNCDKKNIHKDRLETMYVTDPCDYWASVVMWRTHDEKLCCQVFNPNPATGHMDVQIMRSCIGVWRSKRM